MNLAVATAPAKGRGRARAPAAKVDPKAAAKAAAPSPARLVYVSDTQPGIRRVRRGDQFRYLRPDGKPLKDEAEIARIRKLAIPPAYEDVWICPRPDGHLQATGRDARGRKQYRYHPDWRLARDADKFGRMHDFGRVLPRIRRRVQRDLARPVGRHPARESVLAALVRLLDTTLVRVGNDEYARSNGSYGLTTLRNRHAAVQGSTLRLRFKGKHGIVHDVSVDDPRVSRLVRHCQGLPGQDLFEYVDDDGAVRCLGSSDVNDYLREASGADFTAKDFRTWHATVHALELVHERCVAKEMLAQVARRLGNTVAVCRKAYVHPQVLELALRGLPEGEEPVPAPPAAGLSAAERHLMAFLKPLPRSAAARR